MPQYRPLPQGMELALTLAQRVRQLREFRNLTIRDLSRLSRFPVRRIEELESGMETWLSSPDRQMLAKALAVEPSIIQEVEVRPPATDAIEPEVEQVIARSILSGARNLECPGCGSALRCSVQDAFDIDGHPIQFAKAHCTRCPFVLRAE